MSHLRSTGNVFAAFLELGATSFGGPISHLGFFRRRFVEREEWLSDQEFARILALCQILPGPTSSQVAVLIGFHRRGWSGALAAWTGFTLPGAFLLAGLAMADARLSQVGAGWTGGLRAFAAAVVAHAVWTMAQSLATDPSKRAIAITALVLCLVLPGSRGQAAAILASGMFGWMAVSPKLPPSEPRRDRPPSRGALVCLGGFVLLVVGSWFGQESSGWCRLAAGMVRAGALVFGGGHVVLPLLQDGVVRPLFASSSQFMTGYAVVQAMPGPLFNVAAWIGAGFGGWCGAVVAVVSIFLPGILIALGSFPIWEWICRSERLRGVSASIAAALVGLLGSVLVAEVAPQAAGSRLQVGLALGTLGLLHWGRLPTWSLGLACGAAGWVADSL